MLMLKEMEYVYAVYEEQSFSKAARKLYLSQPALSAAVRRAEAGNAPGRGLARGVRARVLRPSRPWRRGPSGSVPCA